MRARWTRLAVLGLLMVAAGPALFLVAVLVYGLNFGDTGGFFAIIMAVPLLGAILVWWFGWWAKVVGIIAALLPALAMFWTAFGFARPNSFFDFVPPTLLIPGAFIAVFSCIGAIVAGRRQHAGTAATGGERKAVRVVLGVVLLLAALSAALTLSGQSRVSEPQRGPVINLKNNEFQPKDLELRQGDTILLRSDDPFFHTFTIDALSIDEAFTPGDEVLVRIPDRPGNYIFYCRPHTERPEDPEENDMAGTLTVE